MQILFRRMGWLALLIVSMLAIGTAGYVWIDNADPFEAFYMAVFTMTTVGYGETVQLSRAGRMFNTAYILVAASLLFAGIGVITTTLVELQFNEFFVKRKTKRMIDNLTNHFIICGVGRVGRGAAEELQRSNVPFVIVDSSDEKLDWALKRNMLGVSADATLDDTLRLVRIDHARGMVCALASDADNLFLTISARSLNPRISISARANEREAENKLRRAGADAVFAPYNFTGSRLAQSILRPHVTQFLDFTTMGLGPDVAIEQVHVADAFATRTLQDLHIRREIGIMVLAIRRKSGEMQMNPGPEHTIQAGDHLIVMGEGSGLRKLEQMLSA
jgi:voltage-gated potassium channel